MDSARTQRSGSAVGTASGRGAAHCRVPGLLSGSLVWLKSDARYVPFNLQDESGAAVALRSRPPAVDTPSGPALKCAKSLRTPGCHPGKERAMKKDKKKRTSQRLSLHRETLH